MEGRIHSFQSMGAVDGPGLRFVVFMQGCALRCPYCHNPDTWDFSGGKSYSVEEIVKKVENYRPYLKKGGVTLSGGEPLYQGAFVLSLLKALKEKGFHTALDTSCQVLDAYTDAILDHTDLVLADVKVLSDRFLPYGWSRKRAEAFLDKTKEKGVSVWFRQVVAPGLNDTEEDVKALSAFARQYPNVEKIELLPFHKLCLEKYRSLNIPFPFETVDAMEKSRVDGLSALLKDGLLYQ